jgi:hypothetical protein
VGDNGIFVTRTWTGAASILSPFAAARPSSEAAKRDSIGGSAAAID